MALPGKKLSRSSKRRRASHFALKKVGLNNCGNCGNLKKPHYICPHCLTKGKSKKTNAE